MKQRPYKNRIWLARHNKVVPLAYIAIWIFVLAFWIGAIIAITKLVKWAWGA